MNFLLICHFSLFICHRCYADMGVYKAPASAQRYIAFCIKNGGLENGSMTLHATINYSLIG
jgi:hypothetical protein